MPPLMVTALLAGSVWWFTPEADLGSPSPVWAVMAIALTVTGLISVLLGVLAVKLSGTTVDPTRPQRASVLVTTGIYRFSRNPMYLGFLLWLLGWSAWLQQPLGVVVGGVLLAYLNRFQIAPEERALRVRFGQAFSDYCARTRRWL